MSNMPAAMAGRHNQVTWGEFCQMSAQPWYTFGKLLGLMRPKQLSQVGIKMAALGAATVFAASLLPRTGPILVVSKRNGNNRVNQSDLGVLLGMLHICCTIPLGH